MWLMKLSLSSGGDPGACVSQMLPSTSVLKRQSQDEGASVWGCLEKHFFTHSSELDKLRELEACLSPFELL